MANIETLLADTRYYAEVAAPSTPASGGFVTYAKTDGKLYGKNDAGTEYDLTASGGSLVLLEQHTASASASLDFTTFISSTYDDYMVEIVDVAPATNTANLLIEIGTGAGPTYDTGNNYEWAASGRTSGAAAYTDAGATGIARIFNSMSNNSGYGFGTATLRVTNLQSTAHRKTLQGTGQFVTSAPANAFFMFGMQWVTLATAVTALRFIMSSGNIASGTIRIYGIAK